MVNQWCSLDGRVAVVTGANGFLGSAISHALAECGSDLILLDHPESEVDKLVSEIKDRWSVDVASFKCDLEFEDQRSEFIKWARKRRVDILINNAAFVGTSNLAGWAVPFHQQTLETWRRAVEVNLTAVFHLTQGLAETLVKHQNGSIVNIASIYGELGPDMSLYRSTKMSNPAAYGASKAGLLQLTRWLATNLAPSIRVNSVSPGGIFRDQPQIFVERYEQRTPLKRMAREHDVLGAVVFLVSDMSLYITGQNIRVDGGWGSW